MNAIIETSLGTITLSLAAEKAPETVANFVQYAKDGHYDGTIFHRVIDGFMIQGGGFTRDMNQKPTRAPIRNEAMNQVFLAAKGYQLISCMGNKWFPQSALSEIFSFFRLYIAV